LDPAVGKVETRATACDRGSSLAVGVLDLRSAELDRHRIAVLGETVDDWTARISECEQFRDFVESLSGRVIARVTNVLVGPAVAFGLGKIKMSMSARDNQRQHGKVHAMIAFLALFEQHGVDVSLEVIYGDERLFESEGERFGIAQPDKQRAGQARPLRD